MLQEGTVPCLKLSCHVSKAYGRSAPESIRPRSISPCLPQTRSFRPNFWDVLPLVLGHSTPIKLHQILTEVGNNDDTPWAIAVGWIGNSKLQWRQVQHASASSRLTPVEWADLWRHPSPMSRAGAARSAQQWSRLNVWSNAETGVNSPTQLLTNTVQWVYQNHIQSTCRYMASSRGHAEGQGQDRYRSIGNIRLKKLQF